jgi:hypothetical protein
MNVAKYRKFIWAFAAAAATALGAVLTDGVTNQEWLYVGVTALAAVGVIVTPNAPSE